MKTLTLELPDEVYEILERTAKAGSLPPADWIAERVPTLFAGRKPRPVLTPEEHEIALSHLRRHAGAVNSGDPDSANNERIDEDLTREYGSTHEDED
jgi:hypothetical protein